jgi:hypothetical protein
VVAQLSHIIHTFYNVGENISLQQQNFDIMCWVENLWQFARTVLPGKVLVILAVNFSAIIMVTECVRTPPISACFFEFTEANRYLLQKNAHMQCTSSQ